jgi:hypothetical protein
MVQLSNIGIMCGDLCSTSGYNFKNLSHNPEIHLYLYTITTSIQLMEDVVWLAALVLH